MIQAAHKFLVERLTKKRIRSKILFELKKHKEEDRKEKSHKIKNKLFRTLLFRKAKTVMFYVSFGGEVDTHDMIEEAKQSGKIVAVPVCEHHRIRLKPCMFTHKRHLKKGPLGVLEPAVKKLIGIKDLDLIIVPGLAFDRKGNRLGRGRGCYDTFLKRIANKIPSIGLAFDFQILPVVPTTKGDIRVDRVIFA